MSSNTAFIYSIGDLRKRRQASSDAIEPGGGCGTACDSHHRDARVEASSPTVVHAPTAREGTQRSERARGASRETVRRLAKYRSGQVVVAAVDLRNDGSVPDMEEHALLVGAGGPGEIVVVGRHEEGQMPRYIVDFGVAVLGCLEEEILLVPQARLTGS